MSKDFPIYNEVLNLEINQQDKVFIPFKTAIALYRYGFKTEQIAWFVYFSGDIVSEEKQILLYQEKLKRLFLEREEELADAGNLLSSLALEKEAYYYLLSLEKQDNLASEKFTVLNYLSAKEKGEDLSNFPMEIISNVLMKILFDLRAKNETEGAKQLNYCITQYQQSKYVLDGLNNAKFPLDEGNYLMEE
jgi:hypothetical protein